MAANPLYVADPTLEPFNIFNDAGFPHQPIVPSLPQGNCNFVDLTPGANGTRCGCRRFWPRQNISSSLVDETAWCMCAHHACYHDQEPHDGLQQQQHTGQENKASLSVQGPLSQIADVPANPVVEVASSMLDFSAISPGIPLSFVHDLPVVEDETCNAHNRSPIPESMPDTLAWDACLDNPSAAVCRQAGKSEAGGVPHLPQQQLILSQATSTTSSARIRNLRPFGGKGLDTLSRKTSMPEVSCRQEPLGRGGPSPQLSPQEHPRRHSACVSVSAGEKGLGSPRQETAAARKEPRTDATHDEKHSRETLRSLYDTVCGHEERLDRLETVSFSAHGHEECLEKHDHMDLRVTELEQRMEGVEKTAAQSARNADAGDDDAATSISSTAASATNHLHHEEIMNQISNLQARVIHMQSFLPSPSFAWVVEVVFLPFPLNRLWQEASHFKSDQPFGSDDWTQRSTTATSATMRTQSPFCSDWATGKREAAEWLYPRACGDKSTQDRRLRSRGLIRMVSFCDPDAKSVRAAVHDAFEAEFRTMGMTPRRDTSNPLVSKYLGLQETWVPLRKVHKDSRLRFLGAAELLTPAFWDVNFLHSVTMKAVQPRLFITHPDAYIQDYAAYETGWTWQRIRDMEEVCPDVTESQQVREADAVEHCWHWNEQLDGAPNTLKGSNVRQSCERRSTSPMAPDQPTPRGPLRSTSASVVRGEPRQFTSGRRAPRPPRIRTTSSPGVQAVRSVSVSAGSGHRRIVSYGQSRQSSPFARGLSQPGVLKRQRSTRSPSYLRQTPRWTASPSPVPSALTKRHLARGVSPLAYATPHSNVPLQELRLVRASSVARSACDQLGVAYATDELFDVEMYESGSDESCFEDGQDDEDEDGEERDSDRAAGFTHIFDKMQRGSHDGQLPEDEPWPGIEDQPQGDDHESNASSQPSEYPATRGAWSTEYIGEPGFRIHEDGE